MIMPCKKGDCYDNAAMESWNYSLKVEAIHGEKFLTRAEAKQQVLEYFEVYYNRIRLHSKLGYLSLETFEAKMFSWQSVVKLGKDQLQPIYCLLKNLQRN